MASAACDATSVALVTADSSDRLVCAAFNFVAAIQEGDLVIPSDGLTILGIGRVKGDYFYEPGSDAPHRRHVKWLSWDEWKTQPNSKTF